MTHEHDNLSNMIIYQTYHFYDIVNYINLYLRIYKYFYVNNSTVLYLYILIHDIVNLG